MKVFFREVRGNLYYTLRFLALAGVTGLVVGAVSVIFARLDQIASGARQNFPLIILALPVAGLLIVYLYHLAGAYKPRGTNLVFLTVQNKEALPVRMAPLIFVSTILTHLCGGSVGREGAALQLGGALGSGLGKIQGLNFSDEDKRLLVMCGMSAAFSAIFGTPVAAAIFPLEVVNIGILQYSMLLPCAFSSLVAVRLAYHCGVEGEGLHFAAPPPLEAVEALKVMALAFCCAILSILFCKLLKYSHMVFASIHESQYVQIIVGGVLFLIITAFTYYIGAPRYMGAGMDVIMGATKGDAYWFDCFFKMLLTAICIGSGFKGGEIVPSLFIGATFGSFFAGMVGLPPSLGASCGMAALFCGVTNCPISSLLIISELFGFNQGGLYFLLSVAISFVMSGYFGLYSAQRIAYSKFRPRYIDRIPGAYDDELELGDATLDKSNLNS
ncbi:MAG: chloride channel protein [Lachnospiraceae bacterium]|nr:chloride channel protein [Lachnospiraceae bacterium]